MNHPFFNLKMKLVFFDIECACVHKTYAKICAFGYVVCDEQFNILEKEDILINPKGRFELTDRKGEKGINLPYDYAAFKNHPPFPKVYNRIKELLEDEEACVFGHAVLNDVKYLNLETKRFKLPSFNFRFTDSQILFMALINDFSRQFGLEFISNKLGVEFTPHRAADDAYATMRIVEAMCKEKGCGYQELLKELGVSFGKIENYNISRPQSKGMRAYNREKSEEKKARSRARIQFFNNVSRKKQKKGGKFYGKTFTFARPLENNIEISIPLVNRIYEQGGRYSSQLDECRYYVCLEGDDGVRTQTARARAGIDVISLNTLQEFLK